MKEFPEVQPLRDKKRLKIVVVLLAAAAILAVFYSLKMQAFSLEETNPILSASAYQTSIGRPISVKVTATGDALADETVFVLSFSGDEAGLSSDYLFTDQSTEISTEDGETIQLFSEEAESSTLYYFSLPANETKSIGLDCTAAASSETSTPTLNISSASGSTLDAAKEALNDETTDQTNRSITLSWIDSQTLTSVDQSTSVLSEENEETDSQELDPAQSEPQTYSLMAAAATTTITTTLTSDQTSYEAGQTVTLSLNILCSKEYASGKPITVDLTDDTLDLFPADGTWAVVSGDVSIGTGSHSLNLTTTSKKLTTIDLTYTYRLPYISTIDTHTITAVTSYIKDNNNTYSDSTTTAYSVTAPTNLNITNISGGDDTYYPGDQVAYTLTVTNYKSTAVTLNKLTATVDSAACYLDDTLNLTVQPGETVSISLTINTNALSGSKKVLFTLTDTDNNTYSDSKNITFVTTDFTITPNLTVSGETVSAVLTSSTFTKGNYTVTWEYRDNGTGGWTTLTSYGSGNNAVTATYTLTAEQLASLRALPDSSVRQYRCVLTNTTTTLTSAPTVFSEIENLITITGLQTETGLDLSLATLSTYYYDEVAKDPNVPFYDTGSFVSCLLDAYNDGGVTALQAYYHKYIYDLMDPNMAYKNYDCGKSQDFPYNQYTNTTDYADRDMQYTKDANKTYSSPFHNTVASKINSMDAILQDGVLVEGSSFSGLEKTAAADVAGDANTDRTYTVDIKGTATGAQSVPTVIVFQVQTSWQMFDLDHANGVNGAVSPHNETITSMATLYDIKHAMIDFAEYLKDHGDGTVVFAITDVEHAGTYTAISQPYLTNDMDTLIEALEGWDVFGNCEHVHYTDTMLQNACTAVNAANLNGWTDINGNSLLTNARKICVAIGGTTENSTGASGTGANLVQNSNVDSYYTIRTCSGTTDNRLMSWLDNTNNETIVANTHGYSYKDIDTREKLVETFKDILQREASKHTVTQVTEVTLTDTVQPEFSYRPGTMYSVITNADGSETAVPIADDDPNLTFETQADGSQKITYSFGTVTTGSTVHLRFGLQAKENYIGSNNVYTNVGTPRISYKTELGNTVKQDYTDEPLVNVPIRFPIDDGGDTKIRPNKEIDLSTRTDLQAGSIVAGITDYIDNYSQIDGTVQLQWEVLQTDVNGNIVYDEDGNPVVSTVLTYVPTTSTITGGTGAIPGYSALFSTANPGDYPVRLKVSFIPNTAVEESGTAVSSLTQSGLVWIHVKETSVLPDTGGQGNLAEILLGMTLMVFSGLVYLHLRKHPREGGRPH